MFLAIFPVWAQAEICAEWALPEKVGALDKELIQEASGMAVSQQFARLYHHNDSGRGAYFYFTDLAGQRSQKVELRNVRARDLEDMSLGPCEGGTCLYFGDIGDNLEQRPQVELWLVKEREHFGPVTELWKRVVLRYPDGPQNAEALAVHPQTGDVYVASKQKAGLFTSDEMKFYRVSQAAIAGSAPERPLEWEFLGAIRMADLGSSHPMDILTSMDISPDGQRLLLLTYVAAYEIRFDLLAKPVKSQGWVAGTDYRRILLEDYASQQEAIAYATDGRAFYFNSEFNKQIDREVPLYRVSCSKSATF